MRVREKAFLFAAIVATGAVIGVLAWLFGLSTGATDALAGAALGLLAAFGIPYAFGIGISLFDAEQSRIVKAREAAVQAEHRNRRPAPPKGVDLPVVSSGLNEAQLASYGPVKYTTSGAVLPSVLGVELSSEIIRVGHNGGTSEPTR